MRFQSENPRMNRRVLLVGTHPALRRFARDPFIHGEIRGIVEDAELMGIDLDDPELMGGLIQNVVKKIAGAVRKRREAKTKSGDSSIPNISIQTGQGMAQLGPGGITWTGQPQSIPIGNTGMALQTVQPQSTSILDKVKENPALLAIPAGLLVLTMVMNKKRGQKK